MRTRNSWGGAVAVVIAAGLSLLASSDANAGTPTPRLIQIAEVNFETGVVRLHNFDNVSISLNGFQFCTQSPGQILQYSSASGLNGITMAAGSDFYVHYNNDAPADPTHKNITGVGGIGGNWADPLIRDAYALALYRPPVNFANGNTMADFCQWSSTGADPGSSVNIRTDEAVAGGVWTAVAAWIDTAPCTSSLLLNDLTGGILHGPANYTVVNPALERSVQIYRVNFADEIVTLKNFATAPISLNGFRFCTQSDGQIAQYTAASGLNGESIAAGDEYYIHWANDAPVAPDHINISDLGGFTSSPLTYEAYALSLYFPVGGFVDFNDGSMMADHCQWSDTGTNPGNMIDFRSDEAVAGGVWSDVDDWIDSDTATRWITLVDSSGCPLHDSTDYIPTALCFGDCTPLNQDGSVGDGQVTIADINLVMSSFGLGESQCDIVPYPDGDGQVTIADITAVLANFGLCSPPPA